MTPKDIVSEENARLLYKNGFDEPCIFWYSSIHTLEWASVENRVFKSNHNFKKEEKYFKDGCCPVSAPTFQEVERWFREIHHIDICVCRELDEYGKCFNGYIAVIYKYSCYKVTIRETTEDLKFEEASNKAIEYCLKHLI